MIAEEERAALVALVDDEEDITTYLGMALEDAGFRVEATNDAASALELLERSDPDLICLDLLMPDRTGISLYGELRRHERLGRVPILILSGLGARDELSRMLTREGELPAPTGFIEKPVDIDRFLATVGGLLPAPEPESDPGPGSGPMSGPEKVRP